MLSSEHRPTQVEADGIIAKDLGDEYLFYDTRDEQVHVLNGTARRIYILCDGTKTEEELADAFAETFRLDVPTARRDIEETLMRLLELGLICRSPAMADSGTRCPGSSQL